jgi:hypothetical protein
MIFAGQNIRGGSRTIPEKLTGNNSGICYAHFGIPGGYLLPALWMEWILYPHYPIFLTAKL